MGMDSKLVAVIVEMLYVPAQIDGKKMRSLFDKVVDGHKMKSFASIGDNSFVMSSVEEKSNFTRYNIYKDRVRLSYEFCQNSMNYYSGLAGDFLDKFCEQTGVRMFLAGNVIIRKIVNIEGKPDSRAFLVNNVMSIGDNNLKEFKRPLHMAGTRFFFPAIKDGDKTTFDIKIESSLEDYRQMFIENKAIFAVPVEAKNSAVETGKNIEKTDKFINENISNFLLQFNKED